MLKPTRSKHADKGKFAEKKLQDYLTWWMAASPTREFSRLVDTKSAGRTIKAAAADFEYFTHPLGEYCSHGLLEVKETEHEYRIGRDRITQLPRLRKREKCGGRSFLLVYHTTLKRWRCLTVEYLVTTGDKGSWNLTETSSFATCDLALNSMDNRFPLQTK